MCHLQQRPKCLVFCLKYSSTLSNATLNKTPFTKVLLLYLTSSLFLCTLVTVGQATNELYEDDPNNLKSNQNEQLRNQLAMLVNGNVNWNKMNVSFVTE